jgi:2-polyprenyl-6-methoxyphenol hydroxylase-like FAD-dependent oxidoreductase
MCALALQRRGLPSLVLERDPEPPAGLDPAQSMAWLRKGAPQSLHPHFLMGRLRALLEARYPDLLQLLVDGGAGESGLTDYLHPLALPDHVPRTSDECLRTLNVRRTTLEMLLRRYVLTQPGIDLRAGVRVTDLQVDAGVPAIVRGVCAEREGSTEQLPAAVVIDASGRFSRLPDRLGVPLRVEQHDSGIWYFTRHYRLRPGCSFPHHAGLPGAMFADFIVGALPADNGHFTVTYQIYREDREIARAMRDPGHFQAISMRIPKLRPWVEPESAEPLGEVFGFGQMDSFWRHSVVDDRALVRGFFSLGDSCVRSNPKFGRGCTWTTLAAHDLADILADVPDPDDRVRRYEAGLARAFRRDWETMRRIDAATTTGFEIAAGRRRAGPRERLAMSLETLVDRACVLDAAVFRQVWTGYHGFQDMDAWTRQPEMWLRLARAAIRAPRARAALAAQSARPSREEMADVSLADAQASVLSGGSGTACFDERGMTEERQHA